jgi:N-6 DNA Methylase
VARPVSTIEYVEQLTLLLFLKMADERQKAGLGEVAPHGLDWQSLLDRDGDDLEVHYRHILESLGRQTGTIYRKAQNRIQDPAKLRRLVVNLINEETWTAVDADLKGDAYEGLLQKGAEDTKSGAGQYFTPRPLVRAMMTCLRPKPGEKVADPACGTGGFLLAAHEWIVDHHIAEMDADDRRFLRDEAMHGSEIVDGTARLCAMNLLLHGIGTPSGKSLVTVADALRGDPGLRVAVIAANPPFGRKSSMTMVNEANVVFFERKAAAADPWTKATWAYDLRTNMHFTLKTRTLQYADLAHFVESYSPEDRSKRVVSERFHRFTYDELMARDKANLDITWLRDESREDSSNLPAPGVLAAEIVEELGAALAQFAELVASPPVEAEE